MSFRLPERDGATIDERNARRKRSSLRYDDEEEMTMVSDEERTPAAVRRRNAAKERCKETARNAEKTSRMAMWQHRRGTEETKRR